MCPSPPLDASVPTARAKRYDLVAGCYPANATITSGVRDKVRQGMLFSSNSVYRNEVCFSGMPTKPFAILYIMHSVASFLRSDRDLHPNFWSTSVTLEVLWW